MSTFGADAGVADDVMRVFRAFDLDNSGTISRDELSTILKSLDAGQWDEPALDKLISAADKNGDGTLQMTEFWSWLQSSAGKGSGIDFDKITTEDEAKRQGVMDKRKQAEEEKVRKEAEKELKRQKDADGGRQAKSKFIEDRMAIGISKEVAVGMFNNFDEDVDGVIDTKELKRMAASEANSAFQMKDLFKQSIAPEDGVLTKDNIDQQSFGQLLATFKSWDTDGNGTISTPELESIVKVLNPNLSDKVIAQIVKEADINQDGEIDLQEFVVWLSGGKPKKKKKKKQLKKFLKEADEELKRK